MRLPTTRKAASALVQALGSSGVPAVDLGDAAKAKAGDPVVLADGIGQFVQANIVARQEFAGYWEYLLDEAIFTAPAHPSWGGAALIGEDGKLLGIGSLRLQMSQGGETADINMVVPIDLLPPILDDLLNRGQVNKPPRPWLGAFSAESNGGVVVMSVAEGGPAAQAGLRPGRHHLGDPRRRGRRSRRFLPQGLEQRPCGRRDPHEGAQERPRSMAARQSPPTATAFSESRNCSEPALAPLQSLVRSSVLMPLLPSAKGEFDGLIISQAGEQQWAPVRPRIDNTLIRALPRAFRWKDLLDTGRWLAE